MDFKEKEMNLELKEQDSEHNKKKKEEGSPKRKKGCFKRVLSACSCRYHRFQFLCRKTKCYDFKCLWNRP